MKSQIEVRISSLQLMESTTDPDTTVHNMLISAGIPLTPEGEPSTGVLLSFMDMPSDELVFLWRAE